MQKTLIYVDVNSTLQINESGKTVTSSSALPTISRGQWQILCVQFVRKDTDEYGTVTLTPVDMSSGTYLFVADNNFEDNDTLMLKSYQSSVVFDEQAPDSNRFNIEGDWIDNSTADMTKGQMSIRINSNTEKFKTVLGNKEQVSSGLYMNIKQYTAGILEPSTIMWAKFVAKNTVRDWDTSIDEETPTGVTIVPIISGYLKNGMEFEFSTDGIDWHATQADADLYYRQRISNINAEWSTAIKLIQGTPGTNGATPQKGVDYWTDDDKAEIKAYVDEAILNGEW